MAIEMNIRIVGDTVLEVLSEMGMLSSRMYSGLGAALTPPDPTDPAEPTKPPTVEKPNGAEPTPAKARGKKAAAAPEPEQTKPDRAAIIDGLTKIYSKGDEDVRLAITKFRDGQGADRLRDLKDDALPAAAELLTELRLSADSPQI